MSIFRILTAALLTLTASVGLFAQSCDASFLFTQTFASAQFEASYTVPSGYTVTQTLWNFGDGTTGTLANPVHTFPFYGTFHCCVAMQCVDAEGNLCEVEFCDEIELSAPQPCEVEIDFSSEMGIDGWVDFSPQISSGTSTTVNTITWNLGDGTELNSLEEVQHNYATPGTRNVCVEVTAQSGSNACTASACKTIEVAPFTCFAKPFVEASSHECLTTGSFEMLLEGQTSITGVTWTVDGALVSEEELLSCSLGDADGATICVRVEAESPGSTCHATDCVWVENQCNTTHLENAEAQTISVYPNPAQDVVNVVAPAGSWVQIFGMNGALVQEAQAPVIDCSSLPTGMYVINVQTGSQTLRQQLAIQ